MKTKSKRIINNILPVEIMNKTNKMNNKDQMRKSKNKQKKKYTRS